MISKKIIPKYELEKQAREARWASKWAIREIARKGRKFEEITKPEKPILEEMTTPEVSIQEQPTPEKIPEVTLEAPKEVIVEEATTPIEPVPDISEFVFRMPSGEEIGRAKNLEEFSEIIRRGPLDSILYHANEEHFSPWLEFKGYRKLAKKVKNIKGASKKVRKKLLKLISRNPS